MQPTLALVSLLALSSLPAIADGPMKPSNSAVIVALHELLKPPASGATVHYVGQVGTGKSPRACTISASRNGNETHVVVTADGGGKQLYAELDFADRDVSDDDVYDAKYSVVGTPQVIPGTLLAQTYGEISAEDTAYQARTAIRGRRDEKGVSLVINSRIREYESNEDGNPVLGAETTSEAACWNAVPLKKDDPYHALVHAMAARQLWQFSYLDTVTQGRDPQGKPCTYETLGTETRYRVAFRLKGPSGSVTVSFTPRSREIGLNQVEKQDGDYFKTEVRYLTRKGSATRVVALMKPGADGNEISVTRDGKTYTCGTLE
jgi:hypothetical protein